MELAKAQEQRDPLRPTHRRYNSANKQWRVRYNLVQKQRVMSAGC
jgi:hypothetical protein